MTRLMLALSGNLFDPPAEATVDNLLICAAVHEPGSGTFAPNTTFSCGAPLRTIERSAVYFWCAAPDHCRSDAVRRSRSRVGIARHRRMPM
jgi:hypothetical protein